MPTLDLDDLLIVAKIFNALLFELTESLDKAVVGFNEATGAAGKFDDELYELADNMLMLGVDAEEMTKAFRTFYEEVRAFPDINKVTRDSITEVSALMNEMGLQTDQQAKNMRFLGKVFNMTGEDAALYNSSLLGIAKTLDMPIKLLATGFESVKGTLAATAPNAEELKKQFVDLARYMDITNLSADRLVNVVNKFDTFEDAAGNVGKLNAMLGGPFLSTQEMLMEADPSERIAMIRDAFAQAGKTFGDMEKYERLAYTKALGLKDPQELAELLSGKLGGRPTTDELTKSFGGAKNLEDLRGELGKVMPAYTNLEELLNGFTSVLQGNYSTITRGIKDILVTVEESEFLKAARGATEPIRKITDDMAEGLLKDINNADPYMTELRKALKEDIVDPILNSDVFKAIKYVAEKLYDWLRWVAPGLPPRQGSGEAPYPPTPPKPPPTSPTTGDTGMDYPTSPTTDDTGTAGLFIPRSPTASEQMLQLTIPRQEGTATRSEFKQQDLYANLNIRLNLGEHEFAAAINSVKISEGGAMIGSLATYLDASRTA